MADGKDTCRPLSKRNAPPINLTLEQQYLMQDAPLSCSSASSEEGGSGEIITEGYDFVLQKPDDELRYECTICQLIQRDPMQTSCGHRYCGVCITKWLKDKNATDSQCPICKEPLKERDLFKDKIAKREVGELRVLCPNRELGCEYVESLLIMKKHLEKECDWAQVCCPNGCGQKVNRSEISTHLHIDCPMRLQPCRYCEKSVAFDKMDDHCRAECAKAPVPCEYCNVFGCNIEIKRGKEREHAMDYVQHHLFLVSKKVEEICRITSVSDRPDSPDLSDSSHLYVNVRHPTDDASLLFEEGASSVQRTSSTTSDYYSGLSVYKDASTRNRSSRPYDDVYHTKKMNEQLSKWAESEGQLTSDPLPRTASVTSDIEQGRSGNRSYTHGDRTLLLERSNHQDARIARHEQQLLEVMAKVSQIERKYKDIKEVSMVKMKQDFEARNCRGCYVWKISNFSRLRQDTKSGVNTALHSPGFYTNMYGYKLCIRVNLNGVDTSLGTHISVFIHFMKGEYDDILDWPFHGRISLTIMDQGENKRHITESLEARSTLAAFQRPVSNRNHKGFGYIEFAPLDLIEGSSYVKNDTLYVKAEVHEGR